MAQRKTSEKSNKDQAGDSGAKQVQENMDEINDRGLFGTEIDPTPNDHYTVEGVTSGKPTPETDEKAAAAAREAAGLG